MQVATSDRQDNAAFDGCTNTSTSEVWMDRNRLERNRIRPEGDREDQMRGGSGDKDFFFPEGPSVLLYHYV